MLHGILFRPPLNKPISEGCRQFSTKLTGDELEEREENWRGEIISALSTVLVIKGELCSPVSEFPDHLGSGESSAILWDRNMGSNWVNLKIKRIFKFPGVTQA